MSSCPGTSAFPAVVAGRIGLPAPMLAKQRRQRAVRPFQVALEPLREVPPDFAALHRIPTTLAGAPSMMRSISPAQAASAARFCGRYSQWS